MRVVKDHVLSDSGEANLVKLKEDGQHMEGHQMEGQSLLLRRVNSARYVLLFFGNVTYIVKGAHPQESVTFLLTFNKFYILHDMT